MEGYWGLRELLEIGDHARWEQEEQQWLREESLVSLFPLWQIICNPSFCYCTSHLKYKAQWTTFDWPTLGHVSSLGCTRMEWEKIWILWLLPWLANTWVYSYTKIIPDREKQFPQSKWHYIKREKGSWTGKKWLKSLTSHVLADSFERNRSYTCQ